MIGRKGKCVLTVSSAPAHDSGVPGSGRLEGLPSARGEREAALLGPLTKALAMPLIP